MPFNGGQAKQPDLLDLERFNEQLAAEEQDSARIIAVRQQAEAFFKSLKLY
jgi:hypothetical protein